MRSLIAWLIALVLPVQGLAAATIGLRGPAHYHDHAQSPLHHEHVEHHHHAPGEGAVEVDDDDHAHLLLAAGLGSRGLFIPFDALIPATPALPAKPAASPIIVNFSSESPSPVPHRLERPPDASVVFPRT